MPRSPWRWGSWPEPSSRCGGGDDSGTPTLTWYTNPDNGGQEKLAAGVHRGGRRRLPHRDLGAAPDADSQREQLVRRLAANDSSIDLMSLDPVFVPEFAEADFLRPFTDDEAAALTDDVLDGAVTTSTWNDELVAAPFWANTQLLWYRKSVAEQAGLDPANEPVTWDQIIEAAEQTGTTVDVTGARYEGYMVWINSLVASAGGEVLEDPAAGKDATPTLDTDAGRRAAEIIRNVARNVAAPGLSTAIEEDARAAFQSDTGGFMVNWPYVYGAVLAAVEDGSLDQAVARRHRLGARARGRRGHRERAAAGRHQHRHRRLQRPPGRGGRRGELHHQRGEPDGLHAGRGQPGGEGRGVRRPRDRREVPDGRPDPDSIDEADAPARRARTTPTSARPRCASSTRRPRSTPTRRPATADDLIVNVLQDRQLL